MPGFTAEEVQEVVDRFLLKQITVSRLKTGNRDVLAIRDVVFDLLTTALLLKTDSFFYLVYLSKNKLRTTLSNQLDALDIIDESASGVSRSSKLIDSTTDLSNAQAALLDLNAGLNARAQGVRGSIGPSVDRFKRSVSKFIEEEVTKNVLVSGVVTETADELKDTIATQWSSILDRHDEITDHVDNLNSAITSLSNVNLPERSIRDIASRVSDRLDEVKTTMEGDDALKESRLAMLELLAMQTIMTKASSFQNPVLVRMPLVGTSDPTTGTLIDSDGTPPSLEGTVSAPYNYATGSFVQFTLNGGTLLPLVLFPGQSNAELRSQEITTFPYPPAPVGAYDVSIEYDRAGTKSGTLGSSYVSGSALASALSTIIGPELSATWDSVENQVVITSAEDSDASHILVNEDTANQQEFTRAIFGGSPRIASAAPVAIQDIIDEIHNSSPDIDATVDETFHSVFVGERRAASATTIHDARVSGTDLVTDSTSVVVSSPTVNFENLGVEPGWGVSVTAPFVEDLTIVSVSGNTITLSAAPSTTSAAATYDIGPDYSTVPAGARVEVAAAADVFDNTGYYRVVSGAAARIVVDRDVPSEDSELRTSVYERYIQVFARDTTTSTGLGVFAGGTDIGLTTTSELSAELSTLQITGGDFLARGVRTGDLMTLTSPGNTVYNVTITSVTNTTVSFTPEVLHEAGSWTYQITNVKYSAYTDFQGDLSTYESSTYAGDAIEDLNVLVTKLIRGSEYSSQIQAAIAAYRTAISDLRDALDDYSVSREVAIDNIVQTMKEQGLDRALDILLMADMSTFFEIGSDEVSYGTNLIRKAATAGREVVPVTKYARGPQVVQEWRPVTFQPDPFDPLSNPEETPEF